MADLDVPKSVPAPINLVPMLKCEFFHGTHQSESEQSDISALSAPKVGASPTIIEVVLEENDIQQAQCPHCNGIILLRTLKKSRAYCPHCKSSVRILSTQGDVLYKPGPLPVPKHRTYMADVLGDACPITAGRLYFIDKKQEEACRAAFKEHPINFADALNDAIYQFNKKAPARGGFLLHPRVQGLIPFLNRNRL